MTTNLEDCEGTISPTEKAADSNSPELQRLHKRVAQLESAIVNIRDAQMALDKLVAVNEQWNAYQEALTAAYQLLLTKGDQRTEERFYLLDKRNIIGNCAVFWAINGNGYTTELEKAGLFSKGRSSRKTDIEIPEYVVKSCFVRHVRIDTLRKVIADHGLPFENPRATR
jgi:hypothetical protein